MVLKYHQAFLEELRHWGWTEGGNIQLDVRFAAGDSDRLGAFATELVSFSPEVVVASSPLEVRAVQRQTRSIPIVFTAAVDPVSQARVLSEALDIPAATSPDVLALNFPWAASGSSFSRRLLQTPRV
jgi:ABC-type uncharacterized transport system substrate-binding protein